MIANPLGNPIGADTRLEKGIGSIIDLKTEGEEMNPLFVFEGLELLSEDQQRGLLDMMQGAINVMVKHKDDPERGDVGWREQTLEEHLIHAREHVRDAESVCFDDIDRCPLDDDSLPHIDHATARIALYYAKRNLLKKDGE